MTPKRSTSIGIGLSLLASVGVASYMSGRRAVPSLTGAFRDLAGLDGPVRVLRDEWGIPANFAESEHDLFFVQGWVQASDRMFQLDLYRRVALGRLAEAIGPDGLPSDRLNRTLGFHRIVEEEAELLSPFARDAMQSFADGVNAFLRHTRKRLPVEFRLLGITPEPWKVEHCMLTSKLMALGLSGNWEAELARAEVAARFGTDVLQVVDQDANAMGFPGAISEDVLGDLAAATRDATGTFGAGGGIGSNNWVIGPRRTATGGVLLCNDPHLDLTLPSIWYENVLHSPGFNVRGFSIPGTPGIVLGHNGTVAWGFTNSCADTQDLYVEDIDDEGRYLDTDGERKPLVERTEVIKVKGGEPEELQVRATRRGPLLSGVVQHEVESPLSIRWDATLTPGRLFDAVLEMNRATDWDTFRAATSNWTSPPQNVVYGDVHGNIGFQHVGSVPVRESSDGTIPTAGSDPAGEWTGTIPFEEMPWSFNPSNARIVTANDKLVDDDYPYFLSVEWMNGYRAQRIRELIDEADGHDVERQLRIQADVYSLPGRELIDALGPLHPRPATPEGREVLDALYGWSGECQVDDDGAIAWRLFQRSLQEQLFGFLGDLFARFLGYSRTDVNGYWSFFGRSTPRIIRDLKSGDTELLEVGARVHAQRTGAQRDVAGNGVQPTDARGLGAPLEGWQPATTWKEAIELALDRAGRLFAGLDADTSRTDPRSPMRTNSRAAIDRLSPRRRRYHRLRLQHPLGVVPGLASVANYGPFPVPGDPDTVWQASTFNNPMNEASMVGPSHRNVIDLANLDASQAILASGNSGHPASPHYLDQVPLWRNGHARPAPFSEQAIERAAVYEQQFLPKS
jgi:penicillin amidase